MEGGWSCLVEGGLSCYRREDGHVLGGRVVMLWVGGWSCYRREDGHLCLVLKDFVSRRPPIKVLQDQTPSVSPAELLLSRETRRTLAQLRTNKSPLLVSYLFSIGDP